uniref:SH3 domain-containing protein n=1 Tax=Strigamia maritima TaxID=126957 RepID=T1JLH0_STRMM
LLLKAGININRSTLQGTCLHEAALCGKRDVAQLLFESGVDVNRTNSYDQTALDIVKKFTSCGAARDVKQMLKEAINAVQARAISNYHNPADSHGLSFGEGELISVLQQNEDGRWKGVIFGEEHSSRTGYFPANVVVLLDRPG